MTLDAGQEKAFIFAQDLVKQLITLSSAIITLSITFAKDFATSASADAKQVLAISWIFYILAIVFGIWALMALTGSLGQGKKSINDVNMRLPAALQIGAFVLALVLTIIAGWWAL